MQVEDDIELMELMLEDRRAAPEVYQPTNYWDVYEKYLLPELRKFGLRDFRSRIISRFGRPVLSSLRAADIASSPAEIDVFYSRLFHNRYTRRFLPLGAVISVVNRVLNSLLPVRVPYGANIQQIREIAYEFARMYGEKAGAQPLASITTSLAGNPGDVFEIDRKSWTMSMLDFYIRYAYCCNYVNFVEISLIVELGSGSGKQVEVIKQLHPNVSFFLFDLPPQLYVCEQYLQAVFPGSVVSYRETREMEFIPEDHDGKIFIFGNWQFPLIEQMDIDVFWSAHGLQEMEPAVAANYLKYINNCAKKINLCQAMEGQRVASEKGQPGVMEQTTLSHYQSALTNFQMVDLRPAWSPIGLESGYSDSFWERH